MDFPRLSPAPERAVAKAPLAFQYADLTQDGQVKITSLLEAVGNTGFAQLWVKHPLIASYQQGILPILTRLVMRTEPEPTMLGVPAEAVGTMELAHEPDESGQPRALIMNVHAEVFGRLGRSYGPQPEGAGKRVKLGEAFAEHTFTKPFAPAGERKVLRFDVPGQPAVPEAKHQRKSLEQLLALEPGDEALDATFVADFAPWVFGMVHTDHNQHVNSLVYAALFEDSALRRLSDHGVDTRLQAEQVELVYRKPCFAGERVVCQLRTFRKGTSVGAVGYVAQVGAAVNKANCALRLTFRRAPGVK
ncbi:MAG TPA: hypothetical protein VHM19_09085 [Polyangiales bacterium]|jgi:hypothetical protein|nr:hypothetical protein [Polyangiales bacterium]